MDYQQLKMRHRTERDAYPENLSLRVHRALSWLNKTEETPDVDGKFIFLWIAFNAAYATEINHELSEREAFIKFLEKLISLDENALLENLVWQEFPKSIRILLDNEFVFSAFWDYQKGRISQTEWQTQFSKANTAAHIALGARDTVTVLSIVLSRVYTLRNQLMHGGATCGGKVNREQLRDCVAFLSKLVPVMLNIMMSHPKALWGDVSFPVIKAD